MDIPTISEYGTFAYHPIPPEHAELCEGAILAYGMFPERKVGILGWEQRTRINKISKIRYVIDYFDYCYLVLPLHMPTPWEMAALAEQGETYWLIHRVNHGSIRHEIDAQMQQSAKLAESSSKLTEGRGAGC